MMALLTPFLPYIVGALGVIGGVIATMFARKSVQTASAQASAAKSDAVAQVRTEQVAETQANADAQKAGSDAAKSRADIDNDVAAKPADEVKNELQNWTRP